jgi:ABC-2 type transport system permease protein
LKNSTLLNLVLLQFKEFWREPGILFWSLLFPMALAAVLGFAFSKSNPEKEIRVAWTSQPNELNAKLRDISLVRLSMATEAEALTLIKRGKVDIIIRQVADSLVFAYDPQHEAAHQAALQIELSLLKGTNAGQMPIKREVIKQSGMRYIDFLIPGLLAMGIMNSCLWGIGYTLIDYRIKKLLRRMVATPMPKTTFLASQLITRGLIAAFEFMVVYLFAYFLFGVAVQGNWLAIVVLFASGIFAFSGLAVLIASRAANSQIGNGLINAVYLPMSVVSGIFFSYQGFPDWLVSIIQWLPLSLLADHIRMVFNEGAGLDQVAFPCLILGMLGLICLSLGLKIFKWY